MLTQFSILETLSLDINSFLTNVLLLYPLKTSENLWYKSGTLVPNRLINDFLGICFLCRGHKDFLISFTICSSKRVQNVLINDFLSIFNFAYYLLFKTCITLHKNEVFH